jgi:hypothetical protein
MAMEKHKLMEENNILVDHIQQLAHKIEQDKESLQEKSQEIEEMN